MNHLYYSFFSPMSFLLCSAAGREASFWAGMLPRKPKVPGFLVVTSAHGFGFLLFGLFYFSSAACAVALTARRRALSRKVWERTLLGKGDSPWDPANPGARGGQGPGSAGSSGLPGAGSRGLSRRLCASLRVSVAQTGGCCLAQPRRLLPVPLRGVWASFAEAGGC